MRCDSWQRRCAAGLQVDIPEMGYHATDRPKPRGEICLRGPNIFRGALGQRGQGGRVDGACNWVHHAHSHVLCGRVLSIAGADGRGHRR